MESEGSLTCSQQPATGPYLEPDESSPHLANRDLKKYHEFLRVEPRVCVCVCVCVCCLLLCEGEQDAEEKDWTQVEGGNRRLENISRELHNLYASLIIKVIK
jgi:hypothetical protein